MMPAMKLKPKDQSLKEFVATLKPWEVSKVQYENLTKDEFQRIVAADPAQRLIDMMDNGASMRDIVVEGVARIDRLLARLLALDGYTEVVKLHRRIEEAHKRGLISDKEILNAHREIRNAFGHDPDLHHIEHDDNVRKSCQQTLPQGAPSEMSLRQQYVFGLMATILNLEGAVNKRGELSRSHDG